MHNFLVAVCFLLLVLIPCLVAMHSSSKEGHSGNSGEHTIPQEATRVRGHTPSRVREAAADMALRKEAAQAADEAALQAQIQDERSSSIRRTGAALLAESGSPGERPSRIRRVAAALVRREQTVPMVAGDPGAPRQSIRDLRAKQAAAAKTPRT